MLPRDLEEGQSVTEPELQPETVTRRTVLAVGMAGAAGVALAACGGGSETSSESSGSATGSPTPSNTGTSAPAEGGEATAGAGANVGSVDQVAVGAAQIFAVEETAFVIAQPEEGKFVAHSAVCPHQGCLCNRIADGEAVCPCHGSKFNVVTGAVEQGPATTGLAPASVKVENGQLFVS